jgi:voltage-dependent calcium channel L type alpha-1D
MKDSWNLLDFAVVVVGYLSLVDGIEGVSAMRTFRLLRPLKTLKAYPSLKLVISTMLNALPGMLDIGFLAAFLFFVFGIVGVILFNGAMDGVCMMGHPSSNATTGAVRLFDGVHHWKDPYEGNNCAMSNKLDWPSNAGPAMITELSGYQCPPIEIANADGTVTPVYRYCARYSSAVKEFGEAAGAWSPTDWTASEAGAQANNSAFWTQAGMPVGKWTSAAVPEAGGGYENEPNVAKALNSFGTGSFDNIGVATLAMFTSITLEGWVDIMYMLFNGYPCPELIAMYFVLMIMLGSFFMLNLALAVVENEHGKSVEAREEEAEEERLALLDEAEANGEVTAIVVEGADGVPDVPDSALKAFVTNSRFVLVITLLICANTITMAMAYHGQSADYSAVLEGFNEVFTICFTLEMILKLGGLGVKGYVGEAANVFDAIIVVISLVEFGLTHSGSEAPSGVSALRTFRLLRVFKLARTWKALNALLAVLSRAIKMCAPASVILLMMMFIFTLLGMQLFGGKFQAPQFEAGDEPDHNFDTFWWAMVTVFQVLTGENWNEVLYNGIKATSWGTSVIYFVALNILGNYIILNLFMAILLSEFDAADDDEEDEEPKLISMSSGSGKVVPTDGRDGESDASADSGNSGRGTPKEDKDAIKAIESGTTKRTSNLGGPAVTLNQERKKVAKERLLPEGNSCGLFAPDFGPRVAVFDIIYNAVYFDRFVLTMIAVSSLLLAMDEPHLAGSTSTLKKTIDMLDLIVTIFFIIESSLKIFACGFYCESKKAYWRNGWNCLDGTIVLFSIIGLASNGSEELKAVRSLRSLRALRPLRVLSRYPGMKLVVNSVFVAAPDIARTTVVTLLFYLIFGIVGVQNWAGTMGACNDPGLEFACKPGTAIQVDHPSLLCSADTGGCNASVGFPYGLRCNAEVDANACFGTFELAGDACGLAETPEKQDLCYSYAYCDYLPPDARAATGDCANLENRTKVMMTRDWGSVSQNFDNVGNAMLTVFEVSSGEMWPDIMYNVVKAVGVDQPMSFDHYNRGVALYFIFVTLMCAFLLLNLFVGVVCNSYNELKNAVDAEGGPLMTDAQKNWLETQKAALSDGPEVRPAPPTRGTLRHTTFKLVEGQKFEIFIMAMIMCNVITMAMREFNETDEWQQMLKIFNWFFGGVFTVEFALKVHGLQPTEYFRRAWNRFDFVCVALFWCGMAVGNLGLFGTLLRVSRVARIFRLINISKGLKTLFRTLVFSLPSIVNVGSVLLLIFFIFACLGMNLFSGIKHGDNLHEWSNFDTFFMSMLLLFRMCTGESYNGVMHDAMIQAPGCEEEGEDANCGHKETAPLFFLAFFVLSGMLLLNICVAIILDNFGESAAEDKLPVTEEDRAKFKDMWAQFDSKAEGTMDARYLEELVMTLPAPLGVRSSTYIPWPRTDEQIDKMELLNKESAADKEVQAMARNIIRMMDIKDRGGKVTFQETLSFLVARAADAVLGDEDRSGILSSEQFAELQVQRDNMGTVRKADKMAQRTGATVHSLDGDKYSIQDRQATELIQSKFRGHQVRSEKSMKLSAAGVTQVASAPAPPTEAEGAAARADGGAGAS